MATFSPEMFAVIRGRMKQGERGLWEVWNLDICQENYLSNDTNQSIVQLISRIFFWSVPRQVCIRRSTIPGALHGVFSNVWIRRGTEMGPFAGRTCGTIDTNVNNKNTWEVGKPMMSHCQISFVCVLFYICSRTFCSSIPHLTSVKLKSPLAMLWLGVCVLWSHPRDYPSLVVFYDKLRVLTFRICVVRFFIVPMLSTVIW